MFYGLETLSSAGTWERGCSGTIKGQYNFLINYCLNFPLLCKESLLTVTFKIINSLVCVQKMEL